MNKEGKLSEDNTERSSYKLAIVGGGRACKFFLDLLKDGSFFNLDIEVVGVCDINPEAEGFRFAKEMGMYTTVRYEDLLRLENLDGEHGVHDLRQHSSLIAGACADLQHLFISLERQGFGHVGDHMGCGDRLIQADGKRMVGVGLFAEGLRDEAMPGYGPHRGDGEAVF